MQENREGQLQRELYEKWAEWGERFALVLFSSLVIQQLLSHARVATILISLVGTGAVYSFSLYWLRQSKRL
jgi:hypothetical protein